MESVPILPQSKHLPNPNVLPLISELFQNEFQAEVPTKNVSKSIFNSLRRYSSETKGKETFRSVEFLESLTKRKDNVIEYADNLLRAYKEHEEDLEKIKKAETDIYQNQLLYFDTGLTSSENKGLLEFLSLKRRPLFRAINEVYVKKYKLLQGDVGLPPPYVLKTDFRVSNFKSLQKKMFYITEENIEFFQKLPKKLPCMKQPVKVKKEKVLAKIDCAPAKHRAKKQKTLKEITILQAEPKVLLFTQFKIGDVYVAEIRVKNVYYKGVKFQLKPTSAESPFQITVHSKYRKIQPGLSIRLVVEFTPNSLDNIAEDIQILIENGHKLLIPLVAYLEPPVLKTHKEIDEFTRITSERIESSYIECGACFSGDTKVTKIRFECFRGSGEFFIMSSDNWNRHCINNTTYENVLEIQPYKVYPVFFELEKKEVIDLYVEFSPKIPGTHVENILIACNNGEVRSLDLLGDAVGWHSYYFSFQDSLLKELPPDTDDDIKVKYYLNLNDTSPNGKVEKVFCVSNNSGMAFDFQWKIRDANISPPSDKYLKLSKTHIKIDPESGTFEPNSIWEFQVTVSFNNAEIGDYRAVLSLYILNLPYQCIEEDNTIIQPTGMVRNIYNQNLYGEEELPTTSADIQSLQGTYESLQESIKSYVEYQTKSQGAPKYDFCKHYCIPNPDLCAKPLKKSKTFFNIGESIDDDVFTCGCRMKPSEVESTSESTSSNNAKVNETTVPKTEVIWDFVDILVDEIEIWVEVIGPRVTLNPSVIELTGSIMVNDAPVIKKVDIFNYNRTPVACKWIKSSEEISVRGESQSKDNVLLSLLFVKSGQKEKDQLLSKQSQSTPEEGSQGVPTLVPIVMRLPIKNRRNNSFVESCSIMTEPSTGFWVPGLSQFSCFIGVSAKEPGIINEELCLSINNGELKLNLLIMGKAESKSIIVTPSVLDFGVVKQATRNGQAFRVINESTAPLFWNLKQYKLDFDIGDFEECEYMQLSNYKILKKEGSWTEKIHYLDSKNVGMKCSILEIICHGLESNVFDSQYIMVLGKVKTAELKVIARRFNVAILAPPGMMYVGEKVKTEVLLINKGDIETSFFWGQPLGCHNKLIRIEFIPNIGSIKKKETMQINVILTPLTEGLISHYYIPCYYSRNKNPLILSLVGVVHCLNVTFEIIDYPQQTHMDTSNFLKRPDYHTVLRVNWPTKAFDPTLGKTYILESEILSLKCHCSRMERKDRQSKTSKTEKDSESEEKLENSEKNDNKINFSDDSKGPEERKNSGEKKTVSESNGKELIPANMSFENLREVKSELEFLNVPYRTPVSRKFVIRNETPLAATFKVRVSKYEGKPNLQSKIRAIREHVYREDTDVFLKSLPNDQPLFIHVEPTVGELLRFEAVCLTVTVYGNTWGEYRDHLVCYIKGLKPFFLKMFIQLVGHPIHFPMFKTHLSVTPVLRFQPLFPVSPPSTKKIKVANRSSVPLTVHWIVFLTQPTFREETESYDSNVFLNSSVSRDESTVSSKNYIAKNSSGASSAFKNMEMRAAEYGEAADIIEPIMKTSFYERKLSVDFGCEDIINTSLSNEELKSEIQQFSTFGQVDLNIFKVEPRELSFDPFEEKTIAITFKPCSCKHDLCIQEYRAVLTCCVKLNPDEEKQNHLFYRPCGVNFVSEVLEFSASVEIPRISYENIKEDLKFLIDANAVINSPLKFHSIKRIFKLQNNNQNQISFKIEVVPGVIFNIKTVNTLRKFYKKYNSDYHEVKVQPGEVFEFELECLVTYKDVMYAFEQLKISRRRDLNSPNSDNTGCKSKTTLNQAKTTREPWLEFFASSDTGKHLCTIENFKLEHRDSFEINVNRMSSRTNSVCYDGKNYYGEMEGEYWELPPVETSTAPVVLQHIIHAKEDINFTESGTIMETLKAELCLSFPLLKISPNVVEFGNVYIGETATKFVSLINLTGFPTEFKIKSRPNTSDFATKPLTGFIPANNVNSGRMITIDFRPRQPGYFKQMFHIYCNMQLEFDCHELFLSGFGTWNEKYKFPKFETSNKYKKCYS